MAKAKIMEATKEGVCMKCLGPIEVGEKIAYQAEFGAVHISCPEDVVVEEFYGYVNIAQRGEDADFAIRVIRPDGALNLEGEDVEILTSKGNIRTETLGELVQAFEERHAIYRKAAQPKGGVTEMGIYETPDGTVYRVKPTKDKERLYAQRLVEINADRALEEGGRVQIEFQYEAGAINRLKPEWKMDYERAKELTIRYGRCIVCGRKLKAAQSVEQGIGPVCIKSFRGYTPGVRSTEPDETEDITMPEPKVTIEVAGKQFEVEPALAKAVTGLKKTELSELEQMLAKLKGESK